MKYYGGCDSGSTYTKCVIIDETGKMVADVTLRSRINAVLSCEESIEKAVAQVPDLKSADDLAYLVGTGYGRNKVPSADENISEISCHAMGVHVADPNVKARDLCFAFHLPMTGRACAWRQMHWNRG